MKKTDLAYIAGIVDGEGCIRIKKCRPTKANKMLNPRYDSAVQVSMTETQALLLIRKLFPACRWDKRQRGRYRIIYTVSLTDSLGEMFLEKLLPYLRVKKSQAKIVLRFMKLKKMKRSWQDRTVIVGSFGRALSVRSVSQRERLYQKCRALKRAS